MLGELGEAGGYILNWEADVANAKGAFWRFYGKDLIKSSKNIHLLRLNRQAQTPTYRKTKPTGPRGCECYITITFLSFNRRQQLEPALRERLIIRAQQSIAGVNETSDPLLGSFTGSNNITKQIPLGKLKTDDEGRLLFLGGTGTAHCVLDDSNLHPMIMSEFDAEDWVDDASDGRISVVVSHKTHEGM